MWYHALSRSNRREAVFHMPGDYDAFVEAMIDARARLPVDLLGYFLMPNHFHLVLRPHHDGDLGRWMQWLLTTHAERYHRHYGTTGTRHGLHPAHDDDPLVTVLRYVERNAFGPSWCREPRTGSGRAYRVGGAAILYCGRAKSRSAMSGGWSASTSRSRGRPATVAAFGVARPTLWPGRLDSGDGDTAGARVVLACPRTTA